MKRFKYILNILNDCLWASEAVFDFILWKEHLNTVRSNVIMFIYNNAYLKHDQLIFQQILKVGLGHITDNPAGHHFLQSFLIKNLTWQNVVRMSHTQTYYMGFKYQKYDNSLALPQAGLQVEVQLWKTFCESFCFKPNMMTLMQW